MKYFFKFEGHELQIMTLLQVVILILLGCFIYIENERPVDIYFDESVMSQIIKKQTKEIHCLACHNQWR